MNDVSFEQIANFRDAGGHATDNGERVRTGLLYRCGHLANATDADVDALEQLGIGVVVDLRGDAERVIEGESRLPRGARGRLPPDGRRARRPRHPGAALLGRRRPDHGGVPARCRARHDAPRITRVRGRRSALRAVRRVRPHRGRSGRDTCGRALLRRERTVRGGPSRSCCSHLVCPRRWSSTSTYGRTSHRPCGWRTSLGRPQTSSNPGYSNHSSSCTSTTSPRRSMHSRSTGAASTATSAVVSASMRSSAHDSGPSCSNRRRPPDFPRLRAPAANRRGTPAARRPDTARDLRRARTGGRSVVPGMPGRPPRGRPRTGLNAPCSLVFWSASLSSSSPWGPSPRSSCGGMRTTIKVQCERGKSRVRLLRNVRLKTSLNSAGSSPHPGLRSSLWVAQANRGYPDSLPSLLTLDRSGESGIPRFASFAPHPPSGNASIGRSLSPSASATV